MSDMKSVLLRMDPLVHDKLKSVAEEAGMSFSALARGVMEWAAREAQVGMPFADPQGIVALEHPGMVWFGQEASPRDDETGVDASDGVVHFVLEVSGAPRVFGGTHFLTRQVPPDDGLDE